MLKGSLRLRLTILLVPPLLIISIFATFWRYQEAKETAEAIFDQTLIALTLAVSRDVAVSGGDNLSITTRDLMERAAGGRVYYHVRGPDGTFVTGYAYPPLPNQDVKAHEGLAIYDTTHQQIPVRAAQINEYGSFDGINGETVTTVWQQLEQRTDFVFRTGQRAAALTAIMMASVIGLIFFGIEFGLRPLRALEYAIEKRSPEDIHPIQRQIPSEAQGIVDRLNALFTQLSHANQARDRLISNAAHQLRNPVAAIQSMAEAAQSAKSEGEMRERVGDVVKSAKHASRLSNQLLSLESIRNQHTLPNAEMTDLNASVERACQRAAIPAIESGVEFEFLPSDDLAICRHDPLLIGEAIENLIDNALKHGGDNLGKIEVSINRLDDAYTISVCNNGAPISDQDAKMIFQRFEQSPTSTGSGLGLAIVEEIINLHEWQLNMRSTRAQTCFSIQTDNS